MLAELAKLHYPNWLVNPRFVGARRHHTLRDLRDDSSDVLLHGVNDCDRLHIVSARLFGVRCTLRLSVYGLSDNLTEGTETNCVLREGVPYERVNRKSSLIALRLGLQLASLVERRIPLALSAQ